MRSIYREKPRLWVQALPQAEFAYNSSINSSTGMSPFSIIYRKVPHHLLDLAKLPIGEKFSSAASIIAEQILDIQEELRLKLEKSNARYKAATDKRRREKFFEEGNMVMVYLRKERIHVGSYNKLKPKKYGSFKIVRKINDNAYVVNIPSNMAVSKMFNVVDLHEYYPTNQLYPDNNSRTSSFEDGGTDVGDQDENGRFNLHVDSFLQLSTGFYRNSEVYGPVTVSFNCR